MERFVRSVRLAQAQEFCKNGHHYVGNECINCGTQLVGD